jgi:hypothetical protein
MNCKINHPVTPAGEVLDREINNLIERIGDRVGAQLEKIKSANGVNAYHAAQFALKEKLRLIDEAIDRVGKPIIKTYEGAGVLDADSNPTF